MRHVSWFIGAVEEFRFFDLRVYPFADPEGAGTNVKGRASLRLQNVSISRIIVLFLQAAGGKIAFLCEYFDPVRAAKALDMPIVGLDS